MNNIKKFLLCLNTKIISACLSAAVSLTVFKSTASCIPKERENEINGRIKDILSSAEFSLSDKKAGKTIGQIISDALKDFWNWLTGKLSKDIGRVAPSKRSSSAGDTIGAILLIVLKLFCFFFIIAFLGAVIFFVFKGFSRSKKIRRFQDSELLYSLKDPESLENKALEYADKGQFRLAVRYMYISMLLYLNESNIIKIDKSKTNKQYLNEIRINDAKKFDLAYAFTSEFNRSWYGNRELDKERFEYWHKNYNLLVRGGN
ncbi:MAG TPA: hypothetical protein VHT34_07865 [Clostridia bacterium]|nr:hypothetical protein [Clostridia bacterium]